VHAVPCNEFLGAIFGEIYVDNSAFLNIVATVKKRWQTYYISDDHSKTDCHIIWL